MGRKIVLISANQLQDPYPVYPIGTAYLKSYLQTTVPDIQIDLLDLNLHSFSDVAHYFTENKPELVGISIRNVDGANSLDRRAFFYDYKKVVDLVRASTTAPVVIGGAGFSIFPDQFVNELGADYGINGEGEAALANLIIGLQKGNNLIDIQNLHTSQYSGNGTCQYIASPQAEFDPLLVEYYWKHSGMLNIQTKRGCPYSCIYCTYPTIDGRCVRCMDIDLIVETIAKAKRDFGVNYWFFTDSVFNIHNQFNVALCEKLVQKELNISWGAYFSPSNITEEEMALFQKSGLTHIEFGTESFCDETMAAYGKNFTFADVLRTSELALKYNVYYAHFMILAGWGETSTQLQTTIENSKRLKHTVIFPYVGMRIYPNTILHSYLLEEGKLTNEADLLMPSYYVAEGFDLEATKATAFATGKAWVFPDEPKSELINILKIKKNKKGPLWEYLRKP